MDYLPINYLNHFAYCARRCWLMYAQGEIAVNAPMLEGSFLHQRADRAGRETDDKGRIVRRRVWVWSDRLQIAGYADFIENDADDQLRPVEYKRGKQGRWNNDQIQLCAQALCLEEMTGQTVTDGEIFYWRSRRRVAIDFDQPLRVLTERTVKQAHALLQPPVTARIPQPIDNHEKCRHCSMEPICLPGEVRLLTRHGSPDGRDHH